MSGTISTTKPAARPMFTRLSHFGSTCVSVRCTSPSCSGVILEISPVIETHGFITLSRAGEYTPVSGSPAWQKLRSAGFARTGVGVALGVGFGLDETCRDKVGGLGRLTGSVLGVQLLPTVHASTMIKVTLIARCLDMCSFNRTRQLGGLQESLAG